MAGLILSGKLARLILNEFPPGTLVELSLIHTYIVRHFPRGARDMTCMLAHPQTSSF